MKTNEFLKTLSDAMPVVSEKQRRKQIGITVAAMLPPVIIEKDGEWYVSIEKTIQAKEEIKKIFE